MGDIDILKDGHDIYLYNGRFPPGRLLKEWLDNGYGCAV